MYIYTFFPEIDKLYTTHTLAYIHSHTHTAQIVQSTL